MPSPLQAPRSNKKRKIARAENAKAKTGLRSNATSLTVKETAYLAIKFRTGFSSDRLRFSCTTGRNLTIACYAYDSNAPFQIVVKNNGRPLIPIDDADDGYETADLYLFSLCIKESWTRDLIQRTQTLHVFSLNPSPVVVASLTLNAESSRSWERRTSFRQSASSD